MNSDKINREYIDLVKSGGEKYIEDYKKTMEKVDNSTAIYKGKTIPTLYHPMFIDERDLENFKSIAKGMMDIANKITDRYLKDREFRKKFGFPEFIEELIEVDNQYGINIPIGRFDIFYKDGESFKFVELNTDGSSAMNEDKAIGEIMMKSLALKNFSEDKTIESFELFKTWVKESIDIYKQTENPKENPNIAILDFKESASQMEFLEFQRTYEAAGYNCIIADPRELEYRDDGLYQEDYRIDLVYRRMVSYEIIEKREEIEDFLEAYRDQAFVCIGSIRSQIAHNKIFFKVLHDEDTLEELSPEERDFVKKHIPYTGIFGGEKETFKKVLDNKDRYIMKPMDRNASQGVFVGRDLTDKDWEKRLKEVFNKDYIYQEYFDPYEREFLLLTDEGFREESFKTTIGLYIYNERLKGIYSRIGQDTIISGAVKYFTLPSMLVKQ